MKFPPVIILIGFMGSGKTSTGKELAKEMRFDFLDTDQWIEKRNEKSIAEIFKEKGENFFRSEEKQAIAWIGSRQKIVIATGGGLWIDEDNRKRLLSLGWCVWLKVSAEAAWKRVEANSTQRPLLRNVKYPLAELQNMLEKRNPVYQLAHASFTTDDKDPKQIAVGILDILKKDRPFDLAY
jgi:shikimate kinase